MTPAIQALKRRKAEFKVLEYDPAIYGDDSAESYGEAVARAVGAEPARVFKTLIVQLEPRGLAVGVVPVTANLDLKAIARAAGAKKAEMAASRDAERSSGYVLGGISPLGQKRPLPTLIDDSADGFETILVSAGKRGLQIELAPAALASACDGRFAPIAR
ncbi:hypothetical protein ABI59_09055 [Acidobacteria bacterium Mor1]|nr:hypothetical protein ABI59_09055 [Acidobacteria bacterium Mor1]